MEGLGVRQACRGTDGYSGESATQLMRQLVVSDGKWFVILACEQWVNVKENVR